MESDTRWKDPVSLVVGALVLLISWSTHTTESLSLQTEWYADYGSLDPALSLDNNSHAIFISPIVADLDGDGQYEVVVASADPPELAVMHAPKVRRRSAKTRRSGASYKVNGRRTRIMRSAATPIQITTKVSLLGMIKINKGRKPIVVKAGFLSDISRKESIVALTEDWSLICFDERLNKKWEVWLGHPGVSTGRKELVYEHVDIYVSPLNISGDASGGGSIVVIGNVVDKTSPKKQMWYAAYGVSGRNGKICWRHTYAGGDESQNIKGCTEVFGEPFLTATLPFHWSWRSDNRISVMALTGMGKQNATHTLTLFQSMGISAVNLSSGIVLCRQALQRDHTYFVCNGQFHVLNYLASKCSLSWSAGTGIQQQLLSVVNLCTLEQARKETPAVHLVVNTLHGTRIFAFLGTGAVYAMDCTSAILWKVKTQSAWEQSPAPGTFIPSIKVLEARSGEGLFRRFTTAKLKQYLVCVGSTQLTVLNLETGDIESVLSLPYAPLTDIILGDFNQDLVQDIIIITRYGTLGVGAKRSQSGAMRLMIVLLFLFAVGMIALITSIDEQPLD